MRLYVSAILIRVRPPSTGSSGRCAPPHANPALP